MLSRLLVPDTFDYMIAGYIVLTVVISIYLISIGIRWRKASQEFLSYKDSE